MKDKVKIFFLIALFCFLFFPQQAEGFVLDLATKQLNALSEVTGPYMAAYIFSFLIFVVGLCALWLSTSLLSWIIAATPEALTVTGGEAYVFIQAGWGFTVGITNLLIVIAFIIIAFSIILGFSKIEVKRALPMLIIVALLVNFTLLFVGMAIDISNFLFNAVLGQFSPEEGNVLFNAVESLFNASDLLIRSFVAGMVARVVQLLIPYVGVAAQVAWTVGFIAILLPMMLQLLTYGIIMLMMSSLFFSYFFIFLARIFIIQILAMLAPLAFFCLIFPQTKKWWNQWLDTLVQWLLVGIVFIFLMYVGLLLAPVVTSTSGFIKPGWPGWMDWFVGDLIGHIILIAYFTVIFFVARRFIPAAASTIISQATGMIKTATPFVGALAKGGIRGYRRSALKSGTEKPLPESIEKQGWARKPIRALQATGRPFRELSSWAVRKGHHLAGTTVEREVAKDNEAKAKEFEGKFADDYKSAVEVYSGKPEDERTETERIGFLQYLSKGGGKALDMLPAERLKSSLDLAVREGDSETVKSIVSQVPELAEGKKEIQDLLECKDMAGVYKMASKSLQQPKDIKNLKPETLKNKEYIKAVIDNKDFKFIQTVGEEIGKEAVENLIEGILKQKEEGIESLQKNIGNLEKNNPMLYRQIEKTPMAQAILRPVYNEIDLKNINKREQNLASRVSRVSDKEELRVSDKEELRKIKEELQNLNDRKNEIEQERESRQRKITQSENKEE